MMPWYIEILVFIFAGAIAGGGLWLVLRLVLGILYRFFG